MIKINVKQIERAIQLLWEGVNARYAVSSSDVEAVQALTHLSNIIRQASEIVDVTLDGVEVSESEIVWVDVMPPMDGEDTSNLVITDETVRAIAAKDGITLTEDQVGDILIGLYSPRSWAIIDGLIKMLIIEEKEIEEFEDMDSE